MNEPKSRVVILNEQTGETKTKSAAEIVKENDVLAKQLKAMNNQPALLRRRDQFKEAVRQNNFSDVSVIKTETKQSKPIIEVESLEVLDLREDTVEAKLNKGETKVADTAIVKRHVSLKFGVVGSGQAGGRIAEVFMRYGYQGCAINTANQDLEFLDLPEDQKYLIDTKALGGTGKDLDISAQCFEEREQEIRGFVDKHTDGCEALILAVSGGGGCTTGESLIITDSHGVESIESLYSRVAKIKNVSPGPNGQEFINIRDMNVSSFSLKKNGTIIKNKINEVWCNGTKSEYIRVSTENGTYEVTPNHPFFIFDGEGIVEREAKDLCSSDRLISAGKDIKEMWPFGKNVDFLGLACDPVEIDDDMAWLLGAMCADGHLHKGGIRFDICAEQSIIERAERIIKDKFDLDRGDWIDDKGIAKTYCWYSNKYANLLREMMELPKFGNKHTSIVIPKAILKSPLSVIGAFVAGLFDGDGFVFSDKCQMKFSTVSYKMADQLKGLLNLLGSNAIIREEFPYGKGKHTLYNVFVCGQENMGFVFESVMPHMHSIHKKGRLEIYSTKQQKSFHKSKALLSKDEVLKIMPDAKFTFGNKRYWHNQKYLSLDSFRNFLSDNESSSILNKVYDKLEEIVSIENCKDEREFFDLSMDNGVQNYLAGSGGFTFIHNTGSGSAELLSSWMYESGKPVIVIYILPGSFDDPQSKHNAITTLDQLADMASKEIISSLILVDNAKIESVYRDLSQASFFKTANQAVVEPLHMFNSVSVSPTNYEALDSMDFAKSLIEAGNCVVFGKNVVSREWYQDDETALMESIIDGLQGGLLASGFNLKEAQTVGILVTAKQSVLEEVPFSSIAYMFKYVTDEYASAKSFKGVYAVPSDNDDITIRFIFSGMGLPKERVSSLKTEAKKHMETLADKKSKTNMKVGLGKDQATSQIDRNIAKIKKSKGSIGKLLGGGKKKPIRRR